MRKGARGKMEKIKLMIPEIASDPLATAKG